MFKVQNKINNGNGHQKGVVYFEECWRVLVAVNKSVFTYVKVSCFS